MNGLTRYGSRYRPLALVVGLIAIMAASCIGGHRQLRLVAAPSAGRAAATAPIYGVYAGAGSHGVGGAAAFAAWSGVTPGQVLDFPATDSWPDVSGPAWLLAPRTGQGARLEYSLPMMPAGAGYSLAACGNGNYNRHWAMLGQNLVHASLADTVVRPGWEFNGTWYPWSAAGRVGDFAQCFRNIVTAMRAVPGQHFTFDWNPNLGAGAFPAEQAYPGDSYVDYVGVDAYDTSWSHYPLPAGATDAQRNTAERRAWSQIATGDHGLSFWSSFAGSHGKRLALSEWGLTHRADGRGGEDDAFYVNSMMDFVADPAHRVAYEQYFNVHSAVADHVVSTPTSLFPRAAELLRNRLRQANRSTATRVGGARSANGRG